MSVPPWCFLSGLKVQKLACILLGMVPCVFHAVRCACLAGMLLTVTMLASFGPAVCMQKSFPTHPALVQLGFCARPLPVGAHNNLHVARCCLCYLQLRASHCACQIMLPTWCPHLCARSFTVRCPLNSADILQSSADDTLATARILYTTG